jgi:hypothetical protein
MKFFLQVLIVLVTAFLLEIFLPWWAVAIAGGISGLLLGGSAFRSFFACFLGVAILWIFAANQLMDANGTILADRVGALLPGAPPAKALALISGVVGGLVAAFAGATGALLRNSLQRSKA